MVIWTNHLSEAWESSNWFTTIILPETLPVCPLKGIAIRDFECFQGKKGLFASGSANCLPLKSGPFPKRSCRIFSASLILFLCDSNNCNGWFTRILISSLIRNPIWRFFQFWYNLLRGHSTNQTLFTLQCFGKQIRINFDFLPPILGSFLMMPWPLNPPPQGTAQEGGGADSGDTHQTWRSRSPLRIWVLWKN